MGDILFIMLPQFSLDFYTQFNGRGIFYCVRDFGKLSLCENREHSVFPTNEKWR